MRPERLEALLARFSGLRLLVVGDFFLDKYLEIDRRLAETSLETGLEAHQVVEVRTSPGAAGNVAANLAALGVGTLALSVIGDDGEGYDLTRALAARGIDAGPVVRAAERFTPTYTKPMLHEPDGRVHELSRLDIVNRSPLPGALEAEVLSRLEALLPSVDGVVVGDQVPARNCGVVTDGVREALRRLARAHPGKVCIVDSRLRIGEYAGLSLKPNEREALTAVGAPAGRDLSTEDVERAGRRLGREAGRPVFLTVGERGILVFEGDGQPTLVPAVPTNGVEIDIVGAGDSALAGIAAALCAGATPQEAALVGNLVASVTIRQIGTTGTATREQVRQALGAWRE